MPVLNDITLCSGTTHPLCRQCLRFAGPAQWPTREWGSSIAPPINMTTGQCPEFQPQRPHHYTNCTQPLPPPCGLGNVVRQ